MIKRFGVSIDGDLLSQFDELIRGEGYGSRSRAIEDMVRDRILKRAVEEGAEERMGVITAVYDHSSTQVVKKLLDIQHEFGKIHATMHIHLDKERCLEIIAVGGKPERIKDLGSKIKSMKGIMHSNLIFAC